MMELKISLFCTGLFVAMNGRDMILVPVANWLSHYLPEIVRKPLFECLICMASVWTLVYWLVFVRDFWAELPLTLFMVAGINAIISVAIKPLFDGEE